MDVLLLRIRDHAELPTPGILFLHGQPILTCLEPPNLNNEVNRSCIPPGSYECELCHDIQIGSQIYNDVYEITGVVGRTGIYFHRGNFKEDTHGCILVGTTFNEIGIGNSKLAFQIFMDKMRSGPDMTHLKQRKSFSLIVRFAK